MGESGEPEGVCSSEIDTSGSGPASQDAGEDVLVVVPGGVWDSDGAGDIPEGPARLGLLMVCSVVSVIGGKVGT